MEANTHLLPIIESHSKEDPVDQEIDKLRVQKQKRIMKMHPLLNNKQKSKPELGQTYFGYDGTLARTSNFLCKAKPQPNTIGYRISERSTVILSSADINKMLKPKKEHLTSARVLEEVKESLPIKARKSSPPQSMLITPLRQSKENIKHCNQMKQTLMDTFRLHSGVTLKKID